MQDSRDALLNSQNTKLARILWIYVIKYILIKYNINFQDVKKVTSKYIFKLKSVNVLFLNPVSIQSSVKSTSWSLMFGVK